ncbi:LytR C-terminal domain-containing protein [Actinoplanes sp. CA-015351]|uniref:LytR C-terminal domain-containing protein n=1 Tax=Actinoplanes sp. CA-015351 TaxID=3239897 RepID=UPI003D97A405
MPRDIREVLGELEDDVNGVLLAPAADVRAQGRRRALRRRAAAAGAALSLVAVVTAGALVTRQPPEEESPAVANPAISLPVTICAVPVDLTLPNAPGEVTIRVVDDERAETVAEDFRTRGFVASGWTAINPLPDDTVAVIRYGPAGVGEAVLVQAYLIGQAETVFVPDQADNTVELMLGPAFHQLGTPTEVNQSLAAIGPDGLPHRC